MKILRVRVKPNSKNQAIEVEEGGLTVRLKSSPVDGKANAELVELLAKQFNVPKAKIRIKSGLASKSKLVEINL